MLDFFQGLCYAIFGMLAHCIHSQHIIVNRGVTKMKKCTKLISLLLAASMIFSMLPSFAAAENVTVEDVTEVATVTETDAPAPVPADPIEIAPMEPVASEPVVELQDDDADAAKVAEGMFLKTVAPDGTVQYFNSFSDAMTVANAWTTGGGVVYLLTDYTVINPTESSAWLFPGSNPAYTSTDEDGVTVYGYWIDLGGHTLTAGVAQVLFGRAGVGSVNIRNGRVIYKNYGRGSGQIGVVTYGYSSAAVVSGSTALCARTTVKNAEIISLAPKPGTSSTNCITSMLGNNEVNVYNSKLIAVNVPAVKFKKSSATVSGDALNTLQKEGLHSSVMLYGKSVVGTLTGSSAVYYTGSSGTSAGIEHSVTIDAEQESVFLGSAIFSSDSSIPLTVSTPEAMMEAGTYSYAMPDDTTIALETTPGAVPNDAESAEYPCYQYPPFMTDEEMLASGSIVKTVAPNGITIGHNSLSRAFTAAGSWRKPGGTLTLLRDYTLIHESKPSPVGVLSAPAAAYENTDDPDLTVEGVWFDMGGHTLTVTAARPLFYRGDFSRINIKDGNIIYRNSGRSDALYGAITVGFNSATLVKNGEVNDTVVNLKNVNFFTLHSDGADTDANQVAPVFCTSLWDAKVNLYDSTVISEDAQAIEFNKTAKVLNAAEKETMLAQGVGYSVNLYGESVLGSLAESYSAITLADNAKADSGLTFDMKVVMSEKARILGTDLVSGSLNSDITDSFTTESGAPLYLGPTTYDLTLPDGSTIASESAVDAKPEYLEPATVNALIYTPIVENESAASYVSESGSEGTPTTLAKAFAAWKKAGYRGTIKLHADPTKDDLAGAAVEVGGNFSFTTTSTNRQRKKADVILPAEGKGGSLTLDLSGYTVSTADIFVAADSALSDFSLNILNGKIESSSDAVLLLDGTKFNAKLEEAVLSATSANGCCIYDSRCDRSSLIAVGSEMTADQGKAIYVLTNDTNKNDTSLLYYMKDVAYTDTAATGAPFGEGTNVSGSVYRKWTVISDGDSEAFGASIKGLLTTEDAAAAELKVGEMTFCFAQATDAITYAVYFGRCFEDVTVTMKQNVALTATHTVENAGYASAFAMEFGNCAFSGNGTDAILALTGTTDVTIRNAAISNGSAAILRGENSYTFENCSINSEHIFTRVSNSASENDAAAYTTAGTGEELYFVNAVDALIYSQCDTEATAAEGGAVKLLADAAADDSLDYNADDVCVIRLNSDAKALNVDLNGHTFKIPGALAIGGDFTQKVSVTVKNGIWEQTKTGASAFRIDGNAPLFDLKFEDVTLKSAGSGISYFAADSEENTILVSKSTIIADDNGIETLNGAMEGRIGGSVQVEDSAIASVKSGYAIVDGVASANDASHILLVGGDVALYSAKSGNKPVKISSDEGDICAAPQYKVVLREERAQAFSGDAVKEETNVSTTLGGNAYNSLTRWTPNTLAYYETKSAKLTSFSTTEELLEAYKNDVDGDGTITIVADVTFPDTIIVDKNVTIQLSGKTLSAAADAIRVEAGKTLNIENGMVKSDAIAIVNEGTLSVKNAKLVGATALKVSGETTAMAQLLESALYALDASGVALDVSGAAGSTVDLTDSILAAPYSDIALQIADGNIATFITVPEIYAKPGTATKGFTVAENGTMEVPDDLVVTMLSQKVQIDYPEENGLKYSVSSFGFETIEVSFRQEGATLYSETIYSGKASVYAEEPKKVSVNNSTFIFEGWKIEGGDETIYKIGELPKLFRDTVFIAVFIETQNIATITLDGETTYYNNLTAALAAVPANAELKIWRDLTLEQAITISKGDFTFNLGSNTIAVAAGASAAITLKANNVTLKNGTVVNNANGNAMDISGCTGTMLVDMKLHSDAIALRVNGGDLQISTSLLVGTNEALYVENGAEVTANASEFYSTNSYALTADGAKTMLKLDGENKIGSVLNGQILLRVINGGTIDTVADTFYVTQALRETGEWYACDEASEFVLQSVFPSRNPTYLKVTNEASGYSQSVGFYAVTSESAAATVNGVSYNTLQAALAAAGKLEGATVVLLRDIEGVLDKTSATSAYSFTKNMTLDLNGHVLIGNVSGQSFSISSGCEITIKNGTIIAPSTSYYNFMSSTGSTLNFVNVNYFAKSSKHNVYASTTTVGFVVNFDGGMVVNYGEGYPVHFNFDGSSHSGFATVKNGTVFISGGNRVALQKRNSTTEFILNIQDAFTYGAAFEDVCGHFAAVPEKYTNPDLIEGGSDNESEEGDEEEEILIQNAIPVPTVLDRAANPRQFLTQKFENLTVKYAQYMPDFNEIETEAYLVHHINQDGVAEFDGKTYGSVADALADARNHDVSEEIVTLLKDSVESGISTVAENVTLDLNGKTLSFSGNADMTVYGKIILNGGELKSEGSVLFKAGSTDLSGETVQDDYRLDQRLLPDMISLTLNNGVCVNFKTKLSALDAFSNICINNAPASKSIVRTTSIYSQTIDFGSFADEIELTAEISGVLHRSGYKTSVKRFADAIAADASSAANFKAAMSALSRFGGELSSEHTWVEAATLEGTGYKVWVDPNASFDLKFTGGTSGETIKVSYTDSTNGEVRSKEITFSEAGEAVFDGLYAACLSDTISVENATFTYANMVKEAYGEEDALYTAMVAYSDAANTLFKS